MFLTCHHDFHILTNGPSAKTVGDFCKPHACGQKTSVPDELWTLDSLHDLLGPWSPSWLASNFLSRPCESPEVQITRLLAQAPDGIPHDKVHDKVMVDGPPWMESGILARAPGAELFHPSLIKLSPLLSMPWLQSNRAMEGTEISTSSRYGTALYRLKNFEFYSSRKWLEQLAIKK